MSWTSPGAEDVTSLHGHRVVPAGHGPAASGLRVSRVLQGTKDVDDMEFKV